MVIHSNDVLFYKIYQMRIYYHGFSFLFFSDPLSFTSQEIPLDKSTIQQVQVLLSNTGSVLEKNINPNKKIHRIAV